MPKVIENFDQIIAQVVEPEDSHFELDLTGIRRGIDNYRIDVALSPNFEFVLRELIEVQVKRVINGTRLISPNASEMAELRDTYEDMMKVTFHRSKTDLSIAEIRVLQFAIIKFVIAECRKDMDEQADMLEETLANQQQTGNKNLLETQTKVTWFRRYREEFQFSVIRSIMRALQREDANELKPLREQFLGDDLDEAMDIMFNPMLYARTPNDPMLQLEYYALWPKDGMGFTDMNLAFEKILGKEIPTLKVDPLKPETAPASNNLEPFDDLGGLFAVQSAMGASINQGEVINETLCMLEVPQNMTLLFDDKQLDKIAEQSKDHLGMKANWALKSDIKRLQKIRSGLLESMDKDHARMMSATYMVRDKMEQHDFSLIKAVDAIEAVGGVNTKKLIDSINEDMDGGGALKGKLQALSEEADKKIKQAGSELYSKALVDYCRFRLHMKYFRFAHRVFNRINLIVDEESYQLAKAGGKLYQLWDSEEVKEDTTESDEIVRHAVIKVDIRGAADVTTALLGQGLNPASYFSQRFFQPINECLETYGATKVFVEGDAVTLATFEYAGEPTKWFCVAQAAGVAKEILDIVRLQNSNSVKTGLPPVEIGIGISFAAEKPMFLFDEDRPIMVSNVIGEADQLSTCSWRLRELLKKPDFNVLVFQVPEGEPDRGDKGQMYLRYNVDGIVIDTAAFKKLRTEVKFNQLSVKLAGESQVMHVGRYPDVKGKERSLVVREGSAGIYRNGAIDEDGISALNYYEILPNSKLSLQVLKLAEKQFGTG